jgi:flagellar hook-associated protein 2
MVSQITLGNLSQQNGRNVLSGGQSGLDTDAIIKALTAAKRLPAVSLETKNATLDKQKSALTDLKNLLTRFRTAVDTLRNPPGVQNASQNIFQYRTSTLSSIVSASSYLGVTVEPGANIQNLTINRIQQLAQETKQQTGDFLLTGLDAAAVAANGDATSGQFSAGTFSLRVLDGGVDASITLNENDSLQTVANKFNAVKTRTGIQATVVKIASGTPNNTYRIIFTGTQTGETGGFDLADIGTVTSDPDGVLSDVTSHVDFGTTQTAQNAKFRFDGVDIERESNNVADLVDGITFTLKQVLDITTPITVSIQPDREIVTNAINNFADLYNELRVFASTQALVGDDGLPLEDSVLYNNNAMRTIVSNITAQVTSAVAGLTNGDPTRLTEIGVNFQDFEGDDTNPKTRNIIVINAEQLASALAANYDKVRSIFEFSFTPDNANLTMYKRTNALSVTSFDVTIDTIGETASVVYAGGTANFDWSEISTGVYLLKGQDGTDFEGLQMIYASVDNATIHVDMSQGIGDQVYNEIDNSLLPTGLITTSITEIQDQTERNNTEITKIDSYIETYRDQLLDQYAALESALSKANNLLSLLDAQDNARNNS